MRIQRFIVLLVVFFVLHIPGDLASETSKAETGEVVRVWRSGGVMGISQKLILYDSGFALLIDNHVTGDVRSTYLKKGEIDRLMEGLYLLLSKGSTFGKAIPDGMVYTFRFKYKGKWKTLTLYSEGLPDCARKVLYLLTRVFDEAYR